MCIPLIPALIGSAILGAGASLYNGAKSRSAANKAQAENVAQADKQAQRAEQQSNKLNQKMPGIAGLFANNKLASGKGIGSTFLTGSKGVPTGALSLGGGPTLLGS